MTHILPWRADRRLFAFAVLVLVAAVVVPIYNSAPAKANHVACTATAYKPFKELPDRVRGSLDQFCNAVVNQQVMVDIERKVCGFWGCNYRRIADGFPQVRVSNFNIQTTTGIGTSGTHRYRTVGGGGFNNVWFDSPGEGRAFAGFLTDNRELDF